MNIHRVGGLVTILASIRPRAAASGRARARSGWLAPLTTAYHPTRTSVASKSRSAVISPPRRVRATAQHFQRGLRDAGYFEGRNVVIDYGYAQGDYELVPALVDDFVRSKADIMVMDSTVGTEVAKRATSTMRWFPILSGRR
jgi:hypothetical protein